MSLEALWVIVAVAVAAVFNVILPWVRKLAEDGRTGNVEPELRQAPTTVLAPAPSDWPAPAQEFGMQRNVPARTMAPMAPASARPVRHPRAGSRSGLRSGIVLAAVLGPCRAQTPFV